MTCRISSESSPTMTRSISNCKIRCRSASVASSSRDRTRWQNASRSDQTAFAACRSACSRCSWSRWVMRTLTSALDLFATGLQLGQVDHLGLVGVDQPLLLAAEPLQLDLPPLDRGTAVVPRLREPGQFLEPCGQRRRDPRAAP